MDTIDIRLVHALEHFRSGIDLLLDMLSPIPVEPTEKNLVDDADYVTMKEVAKMLDLSVSRISMLKNRHGFPHPVKKVKTGKCNWSYVWRKDEVLAWKNKRGEKFLKIFD